MFNNTLDHFNDPALRHDELLSFELNNEIKKLDIEIEFERLDPSLINGSKKELIPILKKYFNRFDNYHYNCIILGCLEKIKGFDDEVIPFIIDYMKECLEPCYINQRGEFYQKGIYALINIGSLNYINDYLYLLNEKRIVIYSIELLEWLVKKRVKEAYDLIINYINNFNTIIDSEVFDKKVHKIIIGIYYIEILGKFKKIDLIPLISQYLHPESIIWLQKTLDSLNLPKKKIKEINTEFIDTTKKTIRKLGGRCEDYF